MAEVVTSIASRTCEWMYQFGWSRRLASVRIAGGSGCAGVCLLKKQVLHSAVKGAPFRMTALGESGEEIWTQKPQSGSDGVLSLECFCGYSQRRAAMGSTLVARRAGIKAASGVMAQITAAATRNANGSRAFTWKSNSFKKVVSLWAVVRVMGRPTTRPAASNRNDSRRTIQSCAGDCAPSARQMPN